MTLHTQYHSRTWATLVEAGWITAHVNRAGIATMIMFKGGK